MTKTSFIDRILRISVTLTIEYKPQENKKMKKFLVLFLMTMCGFMAAFGQLRVANNFGQDLNVTVNDQKALIPYKGMKTFKASGRNVWLKCSSINGKLSFDLAKEVSRSGLVTIEPFSDRMPHGSSEQSTTTTVTESSYSSNLPAQNSAAPGSLAAILKGGSSNSQSSNSSTTRTTTTYGTPVVAQTVNPGSNIAFVYKGDDRFKIFSEIGRGLEFKGKDTLNPEDNARNRYILSVPRNQDLIIGLGIKEGENQAIWRYAEIRKRINSWDSACYIYQKDIRKSSTSENKSLKIKLLAEDYKIFFEPDSGDPISLGTSKGYKGVSRPIDVPVGQFYIRVSYTDARGMFHKTVFVPKHVTAKDRYLEFSKADLDNAVVLNW